MLLVMESTNNPLASEADVVTLTRPIRRRPQVAPVEAVVSEAVPVKVASVEAVASEIAPIEAVPIEAIRVSTKEAIPKIIKGKPKVAVERTNEEIALAIAIKEAKLASSKDITPRQAGETEEGHILTKKSECITLYDICTGKELDKVDPISGIKNYDIKQLERRIREIKRLRNDTPVGLYNLNNKTTNFDFLMNVFCDKNIILDDMVSFKLQEGGQVGSDIYEVLCRLFVIFGGIENINVLNGAYKIMLKIENSSSIFDDLKTALQNMECKATSKMGVSDITLIKTKSIKKDINPDSPYCEIECDMTEPDEIKTYLISVKWYQKEKSAEHYDLEKLYIAGDKLVSEEKMPYGLIVFLKSKLEYKKAHARAYRQYTNDLANTFFGWNEDVKPFLEDIRKTLFQNADILKTTPQELMLSQYFTSSAKPILSLQLHQDLIVNGINDLLHNNPYNDNRYVIGVLPRGGKTFIAGGIIREYINRNHFNISTKINILWITAAPNETRSQVGAELILKFQDFDSFNFVDVKNLTDFSGKQPKQNTVWFCSIQLLTTTKAGRAKERAFLNKLLEGTDNTDKINMIFFDEAHAGGAGFENKKIIDTLIETYSNNIPFIFLTATYLGIVFSYKIIKPNLFVWDYIDVLKTRAISTESERDSSIYNLKLRFGDDLVTKIINKRLSNTDSYEAMAKPYLDFPELYFISCDFNDEAKERFAKQDLYNSNKGFSLGAIFGLKPDYSSFKIKTADGKIRKDAYKIFANLENPRNLISLLTPSDPTQTFNFEAPGGEPFKVDSEYEQTLIKRIDRLSYQTGSRFRIDEYPTLLMFLPTHGEGTSIYKLLPAFASLLMSHSWWNKRYEVACIISDNDKKLSDEALSIVIAEEAIPADNIRIIDKNLKSEIIKYERELHCEKNKGLIILAGERLSMGISLPCTDCVFLLNETKSPDAIIQKMYRALTPSINKKSSFIVDLNPLRSLSAVYGYTRAAYESAVTKSKILDIIYDVYSWDEDVINLQLEKGGSKRITSSQERLGDMLEKASKEKDFEDIFKNIGDFEKQLHSNITKKVDELGLISILKNVVIGKIIDKNGIRFSDKANFIVKKGKLVMHLQKDTNNETDTNEIDNNESEVEDIVIIENFTNAISDFIKYLAITSQEDNLDDAIKEFESNIINNSGKSLQMNVFELLKAREAIQDYIYLPTSKQAIKNPIDKVLIIRLFIDVIKKYSPDSSREIFRQMRSKIDEPSTRKNEVLKIIHRHLTPRQMQKKDFGEVFTPIDLIEKMLEHLPKSDWNNPKLKWLDPANGIGNFPIVIFYKLDKGLEKWEPNSQKRKKHIIENMIYMMELQSNNNRIAKNIFKKLCDNCTPNIWTVDSLKVNKDDILKHFDIDSIDRIVGNPPFQAYQDSGEKRGGGDELYMKFVKKYIEILKDNGYLVFVHPSSWRKPEFSEGRKVSKNSGMFKLMAHDNQIIYLEIHGSKDGLTTFKAATRYDFYTLQKKPASEKTLIKDQLGELTEINLKKYNFLPNFDIKNVMKLVAVDTENKCNLNECILFERSAYGSDKSWVSSKESAKFKYPLIHSTTKEGVRYMYSSENDKGFFGIKKVIFGESGINNPVVDITGKYGMTQGAMALAIQNKTEADKLVEFLTSIYFTNILQACMWGNFRIDWRLFTYFKNDFWDIAYDKNEKIIEAPKEENTSSGGRRYRFTRKIKCV